MKTFSVLALIAALAFFVSCQKQQTEEEKKAEVERQVQERLAAERVQDEKQRLAQDQANIEAREKALADREAAASTTPTPAEETVAEEPVAAETGPAIRETTETRTEKRSTASYGMFYQKLDPYGEWRETTDYGYVWQPREAEESRDWRPYTEGHWVYSDAGWTWVSDEPFGWATYHYGRWLRLRRVGWVWVPGEEWAPAWVSWRTSKDYVGWAPLPPEARFDRRSGIHNWADNYYDIGPDQYAFVPSNEFGAEKIRRAVVPAERNTTIVIETSNVTNITYSNTTIMNEGPSYEELRSRSQRPIERYRLRRQNTETAATVRGDELEISAPVITEVRDVPRPRRVKERVIELNIDTGWTGIADRSAAERARTRMKTEATPPPNAPPKKFVKPTEPSATSASATPAAPAATTPVATTTVAPTATPVATIKATPRPTATARPVASPTPAATATPVASPTIRTRPSPTMRPRPTGSPTPSAAASPSPTPVATATAAATVSPVARTRPSPSIPLRLTPSIAPIAPPSSSAESVAKPLPTLTPMRRPSVPPRPPLPTPSTTPAASDEARAPIPRDTPKRIQPPRMTPPVAVTPPVVASPPATPRPTLPRPSASPETSDAARTPSPRDFPKRIQPPRMTPAVVATPPATTAPAATPSAPASSPAAGDDRAKNRRPRRPGETETATPTPAP